MFQSSNLVFCRVLKGLLLAACEDVEKKKKESENQANILFHANSTHSLGKVLAV